MNLKVKIEDYLTTQEIKEIITDAFQSEILIQFRKFAEPERLLKDYERIIANSIHHFLYGKIDEIIGANHEEVIKEGVKAALKKEDFSYKIFRKKNAWEKEDSIGYTIMQKAITENANLIIDKIKERMRALDDTFFEELINDLVYEVIKDKITQ